MTYILNNTYFVRKVKNSKNLWYGKDNEYEIFIK